MSKRGRGGGGVARGTGGGGEGRGGSGGTIGVCYEGIHQKHKGPPQTPGRKVKKDQIVDNRQICPSGKKGKPADVSTCGQEGNCSVTIGGREVFRDTGWEGCGNFWGKGF